ncbi:MAG: UDP-N-acetylmuramoyl-L-alanine--D-glutamate ligase [Ignavibacteria bacterium]|nr:UDP-N-acetylmuramoyl-L-alanine--D-glutamate ligase [Ignavibacteria bacterium]
MHITIVGAARSGLAAALLAQRDGDRVFVTDSIDTEKAAERIQLLDDAGIEHEFGQHTERSLKADLIVVSPGVPPSNPIRRQALEEGIEVIGELEFAWRHLSNTIVAITGTNGKTTTTALTSHILNNGGVRSVVAGNIGEPLSSIVSTVSADTVIVVEVSSYQLDTIKLFKPNVSVLLNITPDHTTYHGTFEQYVNAKWKIFARQAEDDIVVLNADDAYVMQARPNTRSTTAFFSIGHEVEGAFVRGDEVVLRWQQTEERLMPTRRIGVPGLHNVYNSMAAALAARAVEVSSESIRNSLSSFNGVEHRLETVRVLNGVRWINDSKATNINAAWYALSSFDRPLVWIAGGRADGNDYSSLDELVATNAKAIICIGEEATAIFNHWCTLKRCVKAHTLSEAVQFAADTAEADDVVLFSPACKSFDMFTDFEERGRMFKELVQQLG